jgi:AcrR family transcriptional regulator
MPKTVMNSRKRGDALVEGIHEATKRLIQEVGYSNLTFQQIAIAAETSRSVLYRRWPSLFDLLMDIVDESFSGALDGELIDRIEDTGSFRGDLLHLLSLYQSVFARIGPGILGAVLFEIGQGHRQVPAAEADATAKNIRVMRKILKQATSRGDRIKHVGASTLVLPFHLIRLANLMHKRTGSRQMSQLVDEILLPVFTAP